jgi:transposase InsO family protein
MGIQPVLSAPRSPWQRASVERVIGTLGRECLDQVIVFDQVSLSRPLQSLFDYYHHSRCPLALGQDAPESRPVQPPGTGSIIRLPQAGGLPHR